MIPAGGISLLTHILINVVGWVGKFFPKTSRMVAKITVNAILVLVLVFLGMVYGTSRVVLGALEGENNLELVNGLLPCEPTPVVDYGGKQVILRLDDVQAYEWADISMKMIDDANQHSMPLSLGIIPKGLKEDRELYGYLRKNRCDVEIALHGWDHNMGEDGDTGEFENLGEEEAMERILRGKEVLETLSRESMTTFIPPNNVYSIETMKALAEAGIPLVSSEGDAYFDYDATTFNFESHKLVGAQEVMQKCEVRFEENKVCVIMLHPQDFADGGTLNPEKYSEYSRLLDLLEEQDVSVFRFKDFIDIRESDNMSENFASFAKGVAFSSGGRALNDARTFMDGLKYAVDERVARQ